MLLNNPIQLFYIIAITLENRNFIHNSSALQNP